MADKEIKYVNQAIKDEHDNSSSPFTKRVLFYGWDANNLQKVRVKVNSDGELPVNLETSDIEIGAVEIKNATDDTRATVGSLGLHVDTQSFSNVYNGQNTVASAGTAEVLASSQTVKSVTVKALSTNSNNIYVGDSGVTSSNGLELLPGESVSLDVNNVNTIYIDADTNGEGVGWVAIG